MKTHAFGLEKIGLLCIRAPRLFLAVLLVVTAGAGYGLTRVEVDDDLRSLLRSERELPRQYDRFLKRFPALENQTFILIEGETLVNKDILEALRNLHLDLQFVDGVTHVLSMFSARNPPDENGNYRPVFPEVLPEGEELQRLVDGARSHPLLANKILSKDATSTLMLVGMEADLNDYDRYKAFFSETDQVIADTLKGLDVSATVTGEPALRYEILQIIRSDMRMLNLIGGCIAILVCALFFRRPILILLASLAPLVGVVWTVGGFGLLGIKITAMSNILPTLVLVIGFSDSLHMVFSMRRLLQQGATVREAVETSLREVGPACAITSVTTLIALSALGFSDSPVIQQFGIGGVFAVCAAFVAVVAMVPALAIVLLPYLKERPSGSPPSVATRMSAGFSTAIWKVVQARPVLTMACGLLILLPTSVAYFKLESAYDYREYLSPTSEANRAIDRINARMGGADITFVMIERTSAEKAAHSSEVIDAVHQAMEAQPEIYNVSSIASLRKWLKKPFDPDRAGNADVLDDLPEYYADRLASPDRDAWLVTGYVPAAPTPVTRDIFNRLEADLEDLRARYPGYSMIQIGVIVLAAYESDLMIEGLKTSMLWAILIIMCVIAVTSGSPLLAGLAVVPNLLSLTIVAAALFVLGFGFQFTSVVALTVAFGIAVDNTVHFLHRYQLERSGSQIREALAATMRRVGPVLIAATVVLMLGIGVTQFSVLPMVVLFGRLCMVILCAALLATLMLLPALILVTTAKNRRVRE